MFLLPENYFSPHNNLFSFLFLIFILFNAKTLFVLSVMTLKGGMSAACAACKYQRRRCTKDCVLAPYFPADQPKVFQNAHRLFGVCNIIKILRQVHPEQREEAMKSIKYESFIRSRFPVNGCCEVIWQLRYQLQHVIEELRLVSAQLAIIKDQFDDESLDKSDYSLHHYLDDNAFPSGGNGGYNSNIVYADAGEEMKPSLVAQCHQFPYSPENNKNSNSNVFIKTEINQPQVFLFNTAADDRQSYIESKDACESSAESTLKDEFVRRCNLF